MELVDRDRDLLQRAATLKREADEVLADLGLPELVKPVGRGVVVGSASFGLALTRDIDFDVLCPSVDPGAIWDALRPLAGHPRVKKLHWTDERGRFFAMDRPENEGIYVGIHYLGDEMPWESRWKIDCWFFLEDLPRPDIELRDRLRGACPEERLAVLRLKDAAIRAGRYGPDAELLGYDIYKAVLDRGVRRYEDL